MSKKHSKGGSLQGARRGEKERRERLLREQALRDLEGRSTRAADSACKAARALPTEIQPRAWGLGEV